MRRQVLIAVIGGVAVLAVVVVLVWRSAPSEGPLQAAAILAAYDADDPPGSLLIRYPFDNAVFPPGIAAPRFHWEDCSVEADAWLVRLEISDGGDALFFETSVPEWKPSEDEWETIQQRCRGTMAEATVLGVRRRRQDRVLSSGQVSFTTSPDRVDAPIFYREVNLPFREAVIDPSRIRWRFGEVASREPPQVVLTGLPVCGNCHSFSADGKTLGMDVDYANDKGSYAILPVADQMVIDPGKIITWSDYLRDDDQPSLGLLSQVSPDGKYVVSTVKDGAVFEPKPELEFSQLFFPIKGILGIYSRETGVFSALPGANDPEYVQSNGVWSPDGQWLVFARSRRFQSSGPGLITDGERQEFLAGAKIFRFDLYRIPFNDGKGGRAEPLAGASHDGMSNYFPRYSPDGKWIVFCKASSFMLLQPDSQLYIIPSEGGEARKLRCNTGKMNSWHSWSPSGRWMVFSSKAFSPYTQLFLTHFDDEGHSSPPVLLADFTASDRAANIPEFVPAPPDAIGSITERFISDHNYMRQATVSAQFHDLARAEAASRKAIALNPKNADSHVGLGNVLMAQGRAEEAAEACRTAIELAPDHFKARLLLGVMVMNAGRPGEAAEHLAKAVRLRTEDASAHYYLGLALERQAKFERALAEYERTLELMPNSPSALAQAALIRATCPRPAIRNHESAVQMAEKACELTQFADAESLVILGKVYAEVGRRPEALVAFARAAAIARRTGQQDLAQRIAGELRELSAEPLPSPPGKR